MAADVAEVFRRLRRTPARGYLTRVRRLGVSMGIVRPEAAFRSPQYLRHNQRRQEHLATLGLPLDGRRVLEVGAGVGDHTSFLLDRGCSVMVTDGRAANVAALREQFGDRCVRHLDLDAPDASFSDSFEVVYCYGTLYHLLRPAEAISYLAARCTGMMLVETCVSPGTDEALNPVTELKRNPSQAVSGTGCRPTRPWVMNRLREHFPFVYTTTTQPWHEEFPVDWSEPRPTELLSRAVFVASRDGIDSLLLVEELPLTHSRA